MHAKALTGKHLAWEHAGFAWYAGMLAFSNAGVDCHNAINTNSIP